MAKQLTWEQIAARKEKAERFVRDVLQDDDRADEIADENLKDYAARKKFRIANPLSSGTEALTRAVQVLEVENESLRDRLEEVADIAGADEDGSSDASEDELVEKLNEILDVVEEDI